MKVFRAALAVLFFAGTLSAAQAATSALSAEANSAYLLENSKKKGVVVLPDGLQYNILHNGFGKRPGINDLVTVQYTGWLINGTMFDGTEEALPAQFKVTDVIPGWTQALLLMREGDKWHLVIPPTLGYGARGAGQGVIPPNQTLVFDVTLVATTTPKEPDKKPDTSSPGNGAD
jgi:FKBP-type peptidyl-prolyl cis-trans isomerase